MIIISDSGSTKTDWTIVCQDARQSLLTLTTGGCNPYFMSPDDMRQLFEGVKTGICQHFETVQSPLTASKEDRIFFYGAGCTPGDKTMAVREALADVFGEANIDVDSNKEGAQNIFPNIKNTSIEVCSDMVGAARALCGKSEGIACILGTGSNSCLYDGREIVDNVSPLGFILGDEGSGAHLGKLFVGNVLKDLMPVHIKEDFLKEYGSVASIIDRVYRQPLPNRWLASLSPFICRHLDVAEVKQVVAEAFRAFFVRNILHYKRPDLPINMTGSVAFHYQDIIKEVAHEMNLTIGTVTKSPMQGLVEYHTT